MVRYDIKRVLGGREVYETTVSSSLKDVRFFCMQMITKMVRLGYDYNTAFTVYRNEYPEEFVGCIRGVNAERGEFIWTDREGNRYMLIIKHEGMLGFKV